MARFGYLRADDEADRAIADAEGVLMADYNAKVGERKNINRLRLDKIGIGVAGFFGALLIGTGFLLGGGLLGLIGGAGFMSWLFANSLGVLLVGLGSVLGGLGLWFANRKTRFFNKMAKFRRLSKDAENGLIAATNGRAAKWSRKLDRLYDKAVRKGLAREDQRREYYEKGSLSTGGLVERDRQKTEGRQQKAEQENTDAKIRQSYLDIEKHRAEANEAFKIIKTKIPEDVAKNSKKCSYQAKVVLEYSDGRSPETMLELLGKNEAETFLARYAISESVEKLLESGRVRIEENVSTSESIANNMEPEVKVYTITPENISAYKSEAKNKANEILGIKPDEAAKAAADNKGPAKNAPEMVHGGGKSAS
ncbi:MAG: hypothetical protein FWE53_02490 [Firmicutes bacterium]|nr:hypothetical protein [Bacillota bacterium]